MSQEIPVPRQEPGSVGHDDHRAGSSGVPGQSDIPPTPEPEVVRVGEEAEPSGVIRRVLAEFVRDNRLVPVLAALGGVAAFASLVGEWTVTTISEDGPDGAPLEVVSGVWDLGGLGTAYLGGMFALATCLTLARLGTPSARHNARLAGLAVAGGLLLVLLGATAALDDAAERTYLWPTSERAAHLAYGRGLVTAFAATAALGLALLLAAGSVSVRSGGRPAAGQAGHDIADASGETSGSGTGWLVRRRRPAGEEPADRSGPADLTVTPVAPFLKPPADR